MTPQEDLYYSVAGLVILGGLAAFCFRQSFKKHETIKPHRFPWTISWIALLSVAFMLIVHIVNLFGFETGRS